MIDVSLIHDHRSVNLSSLRMPSTGERVKRTGTSIEVDLMRESQTLCCTALTEVPLTENDAATLAGVFAALGDPIRLRLLSLVAAQGEVCSCNLEEPLAKSQPTVSHHTRVLAEAGLITGQRRGKWMWWRVVPDRLAQLRQALGGS
jgi:ArsR family transcriptional regulator, arsenate/arsenite/antimonite-responsive transcriptional repressor